METSNLMLPTMKEVISLPREENEEFGVNSSLKTGFKSVHRGPSAHHPLEASLRKHGDHMLDMRMDMLRRTQGLYAPIQLRMELRTTEKGARRLPCLPSSHLSKEIILGDDITLSTNDVFNDQFQAEVMGDPHLMAEHRAGLKML